MKVLILGGNGMLGPWVVRSLKNFHDILLTDINDPPKSYKGDYQKLSVDDIDQVIETSKGMDVIVNLSVLRWDRKLAFEVNTIGNYAMMLAAKENNIKKVINTGPHYQLVGTTYEDWDFNLNPDMPPQPGTRLYALTKSLGQEICRVFTIDNDIHVLTLLFYNMKHHWNLSGPENSTIDYHQDMNVPYTTAWPDCGEAIRCAVELPLERLNSKCESFFILPDLPHNKFNNIKTKSVLGWNPLYKLEKLWTKDMRTPESHNTEGF